MAFRDVLVILRPYPAQVSEAAVDYAATVATALGFDPISKAIHDLRAALNAATSSGVPIAVPLAPSAMRFTSPDNTLPAPTS